MHLISEHVTTCCLVLIQQRLNVPVIPAKRLTVLRMSFFTVNKMRNLGLSVCNSQTIGVVSIAVCGYRNTEDFHLLLAKSYCQKASGSEGDEK